MTSTILGNWAASSNLGNNVIYNMQAAILMSVLVQTKFIYF